MPAGPRPSAVNWAVVLFLALASWARGCENSRLVLAFAQLLMDPGDLPHVVGGLPLSDCLGNVVL